MLWAKTLPCCAATILEFSPTAYALTGETPCDGPIEADHLGDRGLSRKADDSTVAPMCRQHHRERTDHSGMFKYVIKAEEREWRATRIGIYQRLYEERLTT